ncbi:predicted peptidase [Paenibacillus popilliae ATCC 14706]|uniref:Predicted peptidase n=1 Tax=Paenibacillus popilliae ATCC 14706 TaxID=1212764 RepID=M9LQQ6_PAEPP|nr:predicted peptidase [Paenibacillus popilliae ATCC 14706]
MVNQQACIELYVDGLSGVAGSYSNLNTATDNEGITDNDSQFKDILFSRSFVIRNKMNIRVNFVSPAGADLMNIILLPENETPLY